MGTGIDVAKYQASEFDTTGLDFVFVKATEGTTYTNPRHAAQVDWGRAHRLVVGHYHFVRPGSMSTQADYFLKQAKAKAGDVLAFDWEDTGVSGAEKDAWLRYVQAKAPHNRVILYCNRDFWLNRDSTSFSADGLWIADPSAPMGHPRVEDPWLFHQYSSAGGTDRNYSPLSASQLHAWAAGATTPTPATVQEDEMPTPAELWAYKNTKGGDKHDAHQSLLNAEAAGAEALAQARANGAGLTALAAKVDKLTAAVPTIDYAKLAAALLTALKEN